jgi:hypothetical protein
LRTDAKENLITAIQIASLRENGQAVVTEVWLLILSTNCIEETEQPK